MGVFNCPGRSGSRSSIDSGATRALQKINLHEVPEKLKKNLNAFLNTHIHFELISVPPVPCKISRYG